jgi:DHA3 family macrolide efflux protein-like MFS transporter
MWRVQVFSLVGSQLVPFVLVPWLTETTGSATALALATIMALLPQIVLAPSIMCIEERPLHPAVRP